MESSIRFRKQYLHWTLPRFQASECCDRVTMLVSLAQWQLFLGRDLVEDNPLPWQPAAESRQDGPRDGLAPDLSASEWSKRAKESPNRPEIGAKLDC
ncbi:MAG: hypothetical protein ACE5OS_12275 [Anaerolineae bacterium]